MNKPRITPAALRAMMAGDMENFIAAAVPGGIEAQEARGQSQLVNSSMLPKECLYCTREQFEQIGVVFGQDADDLFVNVTLPEGWSKVPTPHSMWSELRDARGRVRANIFYKAAFYDRRADISLARYINVTRRYYPEERPTHTDVAVVDGDGHVLFETEQAAYGDYKTIDTIEAAAHAWADARYPDRKNPLAYWD